MIPRILAAVVLLTNVAQAASGDLSGRELQEFLGPVSSDMCKWSKLIGPDSESYIGTANPPLNGSVDIMMLLWTWHVDLGGIEIGGPDRFGVLQGHKYEQSYQDEHNQTQYQVSFNFADDQDRKVMVNIVSSSKADADKLFAEASRLPIFNATGDAPFRPMMIRRRIGLVLTWAVIPILFLAALWFSNQALKKFGYWARLAGAMIVCIIYPAIFYLAWLFRANLEQFLILSAIDLQRITVWMIFLGALGFAISVLLTIGRLIWYGAKKLFPAHG